MNVNRVIEWLKIASQRMADNEFKGMMALAAKLLENYKKTLAAVGKANTALAEKLSTYLEPEKEGRLFITPCAPGTKVYVVTTCMGIMESNGCKFATECPYYGDCAFMAEGLCSDRPDEPAIFEDTVSGILVGRNGQILIITDQIGGFTGVMIGNCLFFDKMKADKRLEEIKYGKPGKC